MKNSNIQKSITTTLLTLGIVHLSLGTDQVQAQLQTIANPTEKYTQIQPLNHGNDPHWEAFAPPQQGIPGRRNATYYNQGANCPSEANDMIALIPTTTMGRIASAQPTFFVYIPTALEKVVEFEIADALDNTIYQKTFKMIVDRPGIVSLTPNKAEQPLPLEIGKSYHWYLTIKCDPYDSAANIIVSGWLNRVGIAPHLVSKLEKTELSDRLSIYFQEALWYEALSTIAQLRRSPHDPRLSQTWQAHWQAMLNSVNLKHIAQKPLVNGTFIPIN